MTTPEIIRVYNARNLIRGVYFPTLFGNIPFDTDEAVEKLMDYTKIDEAWWNTAQPEIKSFLPGNLRRHRQMQGLSSRGMAELMHIAKDTYRSYENNRRRIPFARLDTAAFVLDTTVTKLLTKVRDE